MRGGMAWLASTSAESGPTAVDVNPAAGAAALAVAVAAAIALVVMLRLTRLTKITPEGASMELGPETPAVADLLTGGFTVEDDAVPATVVDLAARGWFTIEDYGDDTIIRTRAVRPSGDTLQPYEQRVLNHIEHHAIDNVVPTRVLTTGQKQMSKRWFKSFSRDVVRHAQQLGLCVRRWGPVQIGIAWLLATIAAIPVVVVFRTAPESEDFADWASLGNLFAGLAALVGVGVALGAAWVSRFGAQRDTPAGVSAAAHWLGVREFYRSTGEFEHKSAASVAIWDHHLAYATAMGLAHEVRRQIPFESEHDRHAWSRATGQWRRVKVRYRTLRPAWGKHPVLVALQSLFVGGVAGAIAWAAWNVANATWEQHYDEYLELTPPQERWINLGAVIVAILAVAVAAHALVRFLFGCADMFRRRPVEGELVRRRSFGGSDDSEPTYHLAIDTATAQHRPAPGEVDAILAFKVRSRIYLQVSQGSRVRAQVSPLLGYVASIETLVAAPEQPSMADALGTSNVIAAALDSAGQAWTGAVGGWAAGLIARQQAGLTAAQLDAVGADGKSVREHLAESQAQLDLLRWGDSGELPPPVPPVSG